MHTQPRRTPFRNSWKREIRVKKRKNWRFNKWCLYRIIKSFMVLKLLICYDSVLRSMKVVKMVDIIPLWNIQWNWNLKFITDTSNMNNTVMKRNSVLLQWISCYYARLVPQKRVIGAHRCGQCQRKILWPMLQFLLYLVE